MGYDILFSALVIVSIIVAILLVVARDRGRRSHEVEVGRTWATYAKEHGLSFVAAEGEWPNRSVPRVVSPEAELMLVRDGERILTRLERKPHETMLGRLIVTTDPAAGSGLPRVTLSKDTLDFALSVFAKPASLAEAVLTRDVARAIDAFRMGGSLHFEYDRARIIIEWANGERNGARLDEAFSLAELACGVMEKAFARAATGAAGAAT